MIMQFPPLPIRVIHVLKIGDAGVVGPDLGVAPVTHIETVVKSHFDYPAMADNKDGLILVPLQ